MKNVVGIVLTSFLLASSAVAQATSFISAKGTSAEIQFELLAQSGSGRVTITNPPIATAPYHEYVTIGGDVSCMNVSGTSATVSFLVSADEATAQFPAGTRFRVFLHDGGSCPADDRIGINIVRPGESDPFAPAGCPIYNELAQISTGDVIVSDVAAMPIVSGAVSTQYIPIGSGAAGEIYARSENYNTYVKSTDGMRTWTAANFPTFPRWVLKDGFCTLTQLPIRSVWPTSGGSLIASAGSALYRFDKDLATWSQVHQFVASSSQSCALENEMVLMPSGFSEDRASNPKRMYVAPYIGSALAYPNKCATVYVSENDGRNWQPLWSIPASIGRYTNGVLTDVTDCAGPTISASVPANLTRHLHGIAALPSGVWLLTGDDGTEAGMWRLNPTTNVFERMTPPQTGADSQQWRAVSIQERGNTLYWGRDTSGNSPGAIVSAPASMFPIDPLVESPQLLRALNSSVFFSTQANGILYFGTSWENGSVEQNTNDRSVRVFAIDGANQVHDVWVGQAASGAGAGSFALITNLFTDAAQRVYFGTMNVMLNGKPAPAGVRLKPR